MARHASNRLISHCDEELLRLIEIVLQIIHDGKLEGGECLVELFLCSPSLEVLHRSSRSALLLARRR